MYNRGKYIADSKTTTALNNLMHAKVGTQETDCSKQYCDMYRDWILGTTNNTIWGLNEFSEAVYCHGTTEAFDKFYLKHRHRNLRVLAGEYSYHRYATHCTILDNNNNLGPNDFVIISLPFADSGTNYNYKELMEQCTLLNVPVLVDCCWFGTVGEMDFNFTYPCIEQIVFSMSKTFPVNRLRIGMRLQRSGSNIDGLGVYQRDSYLNFFNMHVGMGLMQHFSADYIYEKYRSEQLALCKALDVSASPVVSLATGIGKQWDYLNRGSPFNRLCLSDQLAEYKYSVRTAPEDADRRVLI